MRTATLKLIILIGVSIFAVDTHAKRWNTNKDSIIVDAYHSGDESDELRSSDEQSEKVECFTTEKEPGECLRLKRCHPILFTAQGELRNAGLALTYAQSGISCASQNNLIEDSAESGQYNLNGTDMAEKVICCAKATIKTNLRSGLEEDLELYTTTLDSVDSDVGPVTTVEPLLSLSDSVPTTQALISDDDSIVVETSELDFNTPSPKVVEDVEVVPETFSITTSQPIAVSGEVVGTSGTEKTVVENTPVTVRPVQNEDTNEPQPEVASAEPEPEVISEPEAGIPPVDSPEPQPEIVIEEMIPENVLEQKPPSSACPSTAAYRTWPAFDDYPWLAAIQTRAKTGPTCSGSLITERHVMTAAHCLHRFNSKDVARMQIRIGFSRNSGNDTFNDFYLERKASKIIFHKRFHESSKMDNNIALIKLDQPVEFDDHVAPIGVFNGLRGFDVGNCTSMEAGWIKFGFRKFTGISGGVIQYIEAPASNFHLRESLNRVFSNEECNSQLNSQITDKMICAKSQLFEEPKVATDFFRWNDGGPLVVKAGDMIQQVGIKSWAYEGHQYPTVYTRVDSYLDWIRDNLKM